MIFPFWLNWFVVCGNLIHVSGFCGIVDYSCIIDSQKYDDTLSQRLDGKTEQCDDILEYITAIESILLLRTYY